MPNVKIDNLASEIMKGLTEYKDLATADMKTAVRKSWSYSKNRTSKRMLQRKQVPTQRAGLLRPQKIPLNLWNLQCVLQRNISLHTFLNTVTQNVVEEEWLQDLTLPRQKRMRLKYWKQKLQEHLEVCDGRTVTDY